MLAEISEELKNFAQKYNVALDDPKLTRLYRLEQDAIRDEKSRMGFAIKEARKEAWEKGFHEGLLIAAAGMKNKGISSEVIARATGLNINEIKEL